MENGNMTSDDVRRDIDVMLWSMKLQRIRRFFHQRYWDFETEQAEYAERIEPHPRLESVAEHSWHVADTVLLIANHFPSLDVDRCAQLAILHDKMEIVTGDKNPVGRDGTGETTHAFSTASRMRKDLSERQAVHFYLSKLRPGLRPIQEKALLELLDGVTAEARFVKSVDKLQALAFVLVKKQGRLEDAHLRFTLRYSEKSVIYFPGMRPHYDELRSRLLRSVARRRNIRLEQIEEVTKWLQLGLPLPGA